MFNRQAIEEKEIAGLAPYAVRSRLSRGRAHSEKEHEWRTAFQRDKDRILHSTAFRRLTYKTQVFVNYEGDHYRTRLTHTLEVAQIARSIGRNLALNEDLIEAISLAHDLGHGPFGHAGERILAELMKDHGGFDHNVHTLRIVEELEESYNSFRGLNLTYEVREGIKKHRTAFDRPSKDGMFTSLEAEVVNLADEIAYDSHDLDDGLRAELLEEEEIKEAVSIWREIGDYIQKANPGIRPVQRKRFAIRLLVNQLVTNMLEETTERLAKNNIKSLDDVQSAREPLVAFPRGFESKRKELKDFLSCKLYNHYRVARMTNKAERVIRAIFNAYLERSDQLPPDVVKKAGMYGLHRALCDYIAGMTDRFALDEYSRFFEPYERV
ncbi:MAG: deoxyguanosinetriphosphate triphosphohydrolase [Candidatus Omnitrophica bacterium]|nr:deoxyguanosinetriphosphate triphosphohydrolase [Candidatus Omnitrophota bacterium]